MDTKMEALSLLALDELTFAQKKRLNDLTLIQQPHAAGRLNYPDSVDACLSLPLPEGMELRMTFGEPCGAGYYDLVLKAEVSGFHGRTLPIAILKLWWNWQPE